ncbi:MAG: hypothetical protein ACOCV1_06345 [Bacillota bacterium]
MEELKEYNAEFNLELYNDLKSFAAKTGDTISDVLNKWLEDSIDYITPQDVYVRMIENLNLNSEVKNRRIKLTKKNLERIKSFIENNSITNMQIKDVIETMIGIKLSVEEEIEKENAVKYYPGKTIYIGKNISNIQVGSYIIETATLNYPRKFLTKSEHNKLINEYMLGTKEQLKDYFYDTWLYIKNTETNEGYWRSQMNINSIIKCNTLKETEAKEVEEFREAIARNHNREDVYVLVEEKINIYGKEVSEFINVVDTKDLNSQEKMDKLRNKLLLEDTSREKLYQLDKIKDVYMNDLRFLAQEDNIQVLDYTEL